METVYHDARIAAVFKKIDEAERRIYEARKILEYYVKQEEDQYTIEDEAGLRHERVDPRREGLFPGQIDNYVYVEEDDECDT
jgi:hypothetical protein